jgi:hypothetical protein
MKEYLQTDESKQAKKQCRLGITYAQLHGNEWSSVSSNNYARLVTYELRSVSIFQLLIWRPFNSRSDSC